MSKASNPEWQIYYDFLDNLREEGTVNMFGARPYLAEAFDLDKKESREVVAAWMKEFSVAESRKPERRIGQEAGMTPNNEQREQAHCMAQASDYFGIAMIVAERDKLKAQRDALLAAAKWCVRLLDDLAKREQENSTAPYKDEFSMFEYTASKNAKAAIEEAEK